MPKFRKRKHVEGSVFSENMTGFKRGDILVVSGVAGVDEKYRIKKVKDDALTFGNIHWYHKGWRLMRMLMSAFYWGCKVLFVKCRIHRLRKG